MKVLLAEKIAGRFALGRNGLPNALKWFELAQKIEDSTSFNGFFRFLVAFYGAQSKRLGLYRTRKGG